jgi:hypothetical protein
MSHGDHRQWIGDYDVGAKTKFSNPDSGQRSEDWETSLYSKRHSLAIIHRCVHACNDCIRLILYNLILLQLI